MDALRIGLIAIVFCCLGVCMRSGFLWFFVGFFRSAFLIVNVSLRFGFSFLLVTISFIGLLCWLAF